MIQESSFWAQALDNTSPDLFELDGRALPPVDIAGREAVATQASNVVENGVRVFESGDVHLTRNRNYFVLEVPSVQHDELGRIAPIVCLGRFESIDDLSAADIFASTQRFAHRIGRNLHPACAELMAIAFETLKKKSPRIKGRSEGVSMNPILMVMRLLMRWLRALTRR